MVTFIPSSHTYLNEDGIIIPSVTQLISWKFGSGYENVPKDVLEAKARYGTRVHEIVEQYCKTGKADVRNPQEAMHLASYVEISKKTPRVIANEQLVCFDNRLAGTLDLLYENGCVGDIKTYADLNDHALFKTTWQVCLYLFCKYGTDMEKYQDNKLVYLPKSMKYGVYDLELEHSYDECLELLKEYEAAHESRFHFEGE